MFSCPIFSIIITLDTTSKAWHFLYRDTVTNARFVFLCQLPLLFCDSICRARVSWELSILTVSVSPQSSVFAREIPKPPIIKREPMLLIFCRERAMKTTRRTREVKSVTCFASTMASREWDLEYSQPEWANTCLSASCSASFSFRYLFTS